MRLHIIDVRGLQSRSQALCYLCIHTKAASVFTLSLKAGCYRNMLLCMYCIYTPLSTKHMLGIDCACHAASSIFASAISMCEDSNVCGVLPARGWYAGFTIT